MKTCSKCGEQRPATRDWFNKHGRGGLRPECRECQKAYGRAYRIRHRDELNARAATYRAANRETLAAKSREYHGRNREDILVRMRASSLKHEYGLSPEQYMDIFDSQDGVCCLCGSEPRTKSLRVDHCHDTGQIRGLLCATCNSALGTFGDSIEGLRKAIAYLESVGARIDPVMPNGPAFTPRSRRYASSP